MASAAAADFQFFVECQVADFPVSQSGRERNIAGARLKMADRRRPRDGDHGLRRRCPRARVVRPRHRKQQSQQQGRAHDLRPVNSHRSRWARRSCSVRDPLCRRSSTAVPRPDNLHPLTRRAAYAERPGRRSRMLRKPAPATRPTWIWCSSKQSFVRSDWAQPPPSGRLISISSQVRGGPHPELMWTRGAAAGPAGR